MTSNPDTQGDQGPQNPHQAFHICATPEDLPEELRAHVVSAGALSVLKSPLHTDIFPIALPMPIIDFIAFRKNQARQLLAKRLFEAFIFFHSRPFRMDILRDLVNDGIFDDTPEQYWPLAARVWMDAEQPEDDQRWRLLLEAHLPHRDLMTPLENWDLLAKMPHEVTLYRGVHAKSPDEAQSACLSGWSWSLCEDTAHWFAQRLCPATMRPYVASSTIPKTSIIAYLTARGEDEVIVCPQDAALQGIDIKLHHAAMALCG